MTASPAALPTGRQAPAGIPVLEAVSLYRFFHAGAEEILALRGVSLKVDPGEFVTVAGPSGSGKSTLLACIAGLDDPDGGVVRICGVPMSRRPQAERAALRRDCVGILGQTSTLIGHLTVAQNVDLARSLGGGRRAGADPLELAGIADRRDSLPRHLSGGETARAGLAVALANSPRLLLADEPSGELDRVAEQRLLVMMRALTGQGVAVVVASHSRAMIGAADRVLALADGHEVGA